ncbi:acyltransferase family protein [Clostridium fungisolvens]|uniref:Acyltransferase 3 domain-containing protein n=1 Tax=Clostridium fungisolvens TaxID=1604897 RepID=A0A6V8SH95_9CLOT|nr:acyltransferase family protein [Clostridium fungisolvens]GFP74253.1 hypothetical protein bsdtw1_00298 [Clostridium fungisolvens]
MEDKRNYYFDNAKALLIFLVVLTHIIEPVLDIKFKLKTFYIITYTFHMPLFIFLSGYFAKKSSRSTKSKAKKMFLLFVVIQFFYSLFYIFIMHSKIAKMTWIYPNWTLWYLQALVVWYIISDYFNGFYKWFIGSIIIALLAGFDENIYTFISTSRILVFLPFFVLGYYFNERYIEVIKKNRIYLSILGAIIGFFVYRYNNRIDVQWLYGFEPYVQISSNLMVGMLIRLSVLVIAIIFSLIVLGWVPRKRNMFSFLGKYTLIVYLSHSLIIQAFMRFDLYNRDTNIQLLITSILILICVYSTVFIYLFYEKFKIKLVK